MQILTEIIEISNQIVDTLDENGFFDEHIFVERLPLKIALQEKMQRKWEQENEMILTDGEFLQVCNEVNGNSIAKTIGDLVDKGAVNVSINENGEIIYSANKEFNTDEL
jgi:hypothetical protein